MNLSPRAVAVQGVGFGVRLVALQGLSPFAVVVQRPSQGDGPGKTSRYSDDRAYDPARVRDRLAKVLIDGREYDPFDPKLIDVLEAAAARQEPDLEDEIERQNRKLARKFVVRTSDQDIVVPMFRPMLRELPSFPTASAKDFKQYAERAAEAADEERRRILLLLSVADA